MTKKNQCHKQEIITVNILTYFSQDFSAGIILCVMFYKLLIPITLVALNTVACHRVSILLHY